MSHDNVRLSPGCNVRFTLRLDDQSSGSTYTSSCILATLRCARTLPVGALPVLATSVVIVKRPPSTVATCVGSGVISTARGAAHAGAVEQANRATRRLASRTVRVISQLLP